MTATKIRPVQATAPERIYLQGGPQLPPETEFGALSEVTWCRDDVDGVGIPYVRADLAGAAPAAVAPQGEYPHEQMDAMALARYKVVPSHASMLWSHAVVAGDGVQQLYVGREAECQNMARKFAGAFLDGAFAFHSMAAAPTTQAAPALEAPAAPACPYTGFAARYWTLGYQGHDCPPTTGPVSREAYDAGARARLAAAPQAPAAPSGLPWRTGIPPWTDDRAVRVIAVTAHDDFGGVQVHDIRASDFHTDGDGDGAEVARVCTHWAYRDDIWPRADAAAPAAPAVDAQGERDAAFEAVRNRLCSLQRYSFVLDDDGIVRRAHDRTGSWIEFDDAHALFDPVAVDAAIAAQAKEGGAPVADAAPLDVCTDPYNCARCKTHPAHRGDMHHAGISRIGGSA